ncbi:FAD-dependent oxidoreductase [Aspergillus affinis]|uniref:FAD-dependent oxidoreductase n=1 Tax=Aspergillus affinis TaxID=1070780 RepID=UPI0022FEB918|nr:FAD/NAD(P)-binding domain-containing protein [Aspergillus affinis]KAI9042415.1 FAD/NAD(P)-binding domain-containing protein [Aspergillus affinis]
MTEHVPVVIIGGGIGGLTLGAILRRLEIPFVILERAPVVTPQGAGISLAPNCLRVLEQLGLLQAIQANSQELLGIRVYREKDCWGTINFGLAKRWFGYNVHSIERHEFHRYLYEAAGGAESVRFGWNVVDIVDDENAHTPVRVVSDDGRTIYANVVAGADGIRSATRRILASSSSFKAENTIRFTGRVHMSGYTQPLEHLTSGDLGMGHWMLYDDSILTTWPCKENRQWFIGVKRAELTPGETPDRSVWKGATAETVNAVYGERFHPFGRDSTVKSIVNEAERVIASNVFQEVDFPHMAKGRIALLGDAAHSMTSFFGQGACQAIEDATVLADSIADFLGGDASALTSYSRLRERRAQDVASFSARYAQLHTAKLPLGMGKMVRSMIYQWVPSSAWMWYLGWLYGHQPVSKRLGQIQRSDGGNKKKN